MIGSSFNMVHAFLITAYRDLESLKSLVNLIMEIPNAKIYLNIDKRSIKLIENVEIFLTEKNYIGIHLKKDTVVHWGGFNHLKVFMDMLEIALEDQCDYFHTLTGQCRITQSKDDFLNFFAQNKKHSFIEYSRLPCDFWPGNGGLNRVKFYQLYDLIDAKKYMKLFKRLNKHFIHIQKLLLINRIKNKIYYGGSSYFSLSKEAALYMNEHFKAIQSEFKHSFCSEEIAPHTILLNAPNFIKEKIINDNLRYVLWRAKNGETPGILDEENLQEVKNKKYFFARKFDSVISKKLNDYLRKHLS